MLARLLIAIPEKSEKMLVIMLRLQNIKLNANVLSHLSTGGPQAEIAVEIAAPVPSIPVLPVASQVQSTSLQGCAWLGLNHFKATCHHLTREVKQHTRLSPISG